MNGARTIQHVQQIQRCLAPCIAAAALLAAPHVRADEPLWELGVGLAALHLPHYRGSDQTYSWVLPVPYAVYRGDILRADRNGARAVLLENERFDVDLSFSASPPTRSRNNRAREGMPDLKPTVEAGPNINLTLAKGATWKLDARLPLRAVVTAERDPHSLGFTASPVLNLDMRWQGWNFGIQGGPVAATKRYHDYFYGVDAAYATAARPAYRTDGANLAYGGWRATLAASRRIGDFWLGGFVRSDSVDGAAFDGSPLIKQRNNVSAGFVLSWVFKASDVRVAVER